MDQCAERGCERKNTALTFSGAFCPDPPTLAPTKWREMVRPIPEPPAWREREASARRKGSLATSRHVRMLEPIRDCQLLLARGMGLGAHDNLLQAGIQPILTDICEIEPAIQAYLEGRLADHPERLH